MSLLERQRPLLFAAICLAIIVILQPILKTLLDLTKSRFEQEPKTILIANYEATKNFDPEAARTINRATGACRQELVWFVDEQVKRPIAFKLEGTCSESREPQELGCLVLSNFQASTLGLVEIDQGHPFDNTYTREMCLQACHSYGHAYAGHHAFNMSCYCGDQFQAEHQNLIRTGDDHSFRCNKQNQLFWHQVNSNGNTTLSLEANSSVGDEAIQRGKIKIAFLLSLNGRSLLQVQRLLKLIYARHHLYYLHVDKRQQYLYDHLLPLEAGSSNIILARGRLSPIWGGSSLLRMMLEAMRELARFGRWDYLINLSESDMPLKSLAEVEQYLSSRPRSTIYLKAHSLTGSKFIKKQGLDQTFYECGHRMWRLGKRQLPTGIVYSGGSDWFALPRKYCNFILSESANSSGLVEPLLSLFNHTLLPAESFFHTLALNSKFCRDLVDNNLRVTNWHRKRRNCGCQHKEVVDWCGCSPVIYRWSDLNRLQQTKSVPWLLFSRKFDPTVSSSIIGAVERHLVQGDSSPGDPLDLDTRYWLSVWEFGGGQPNGETAIKSLMQYATFALNQTQEQAHLNQLQQPVPKSFDLYFHRDRFIGVLVKYCHSSGECFQILIERNTTIHLQDYNPSCFNSASQRQLRVIEVNHDFDIGERIFRNYLPLNANSNVVVYHEWHVAPQQNQQRNGVQFRWIDPEGSVRLNQNTKLGVNGKPNRTHLYLAHRLDIDGPLRSGIWHLIVLKDRVKCLDYQFMIFNESSFDQSSLTQEQFDHFYTVTRVCSSTNGAQHQHCSQLEWSLEARDEKLKSYTLVK